MENILKLIEREIESLEYDINYHTKAVQKATVKKADLELELESLRVKLGEDQKSN